ncbi:hypothetical protein FH972_025586 [Carpinus fangiana]|uniref:Uncharacterized protein n=1 Tax=Carpinus fangiana TaxID=176857 RepID=A0A5N6L414_9ROSI|nr:hypothetical protein FH972_025586 [Carpinus fangiana]
MVETTIKQEHSLRLSAVESRKTHPPKSMSTVDSEAIEATDVTKLPRRSTPSVSDLGTREDVIPLSRPGGLCIVLNTPKEQFPIHEVGHAFLTSWQCLLEYTSLINDPALAALESAINLVVMGPVRLTRTYACDQS